MSRISIITLVAMRVLGILFVFMLACIVFLSAVPGTPPITSAVGLINAPIYRIDTIADGEIAELNLRVGQEIESGQDVAGIKLNPHDRAFLLPLQLERVRLTQRARQLQSRARHVAEQSAQLHGQITAARRIVRDQLAALKDQTASEMRLEQARVARLEAAITDKRGLVEIGLLGADALYAYQEELENARHQLQLAQSKLVGQSSIIESLDNSVYLESYNRDLATLEGRFRTLERERAEALIEAASLEDQVAEMERLLAGYADAAPSQDFASVQAQQAGKVVSVAASVGDRVLRGHTIARALDCSRAFAVAVFAARDVADIAVGSSAAVKLQNRDARYAGRVTRMLRSFDVDDDSAFFIAFPEAKPSETYVIVEVDGGDRNDPAKAGFDCHIGEPVSVAVGEPLRDRLARIYVKWRGTDGDGGGSAVSGWQHRAALVLQQAAESTTSWLRERSGRLGVSTDRLDGNAIRSPSATGLRDGSALFEPVGAEEAVRLPSAFDRNAISAVDENGPGVRRPRGLE
jgi:multidrug resistance efflux pump